MYYRLFDGFIKRRDTYPGGPPAYFEDWTEAVPCAIDALYGVQTILGDGVVVSGCKFT